MLFFDEETERICAELGPAGDLTFLWGSRGIRAQYVTDPIEEPPAVVSLAYVK
jgi:hypothetical protein